jgi:hypothetical protein
LHRFCSQDDEYHGGDGKEEDDDAMRLRSRGIDGNPPHDSVCVSVLGDLGDVVIFLATFLVFLL